MRQWCGHRDRPTAVRDGLVEATPLPREPSEVGDEPGRMHGVPAAPVHRQRLLHPLLRAVPLPRRDGRERRLEDRPLEALEVADAAQERLQLVEHRAERRQLAQVGVDVLEPVQRGGQCPVGARGVRCGHGTRSPVERLGEPQPVRGDHGEPPLQPGLVLPVAQRLGDAQAAQQPCGALVDRRVQRQHGDTAQGAQGEHLAAEVTGVAGGFQRDLVIRNARRERAQPLVGLAAGQAGAGRQLRVVGVLHGPAEQHLGVGERVPAQRVLPGQQQRAGGAHPVPRRRGVPGHRLGRTRQQVRRAAVVGDPHRLRGGRVEHLLDEVVGELVAAPGDHQQPGRGRPLAALQGDLRGHVQHRGDHGGVDGRAEHGARAQELLGLRARAAQPRQHRRLQGLGHAVLARLQPPQRLDDEQGVPAGAAQDRRRQLGVPARRREPGDRRLVERPDVDPAADVGEGGQRGTAFLRADRGEGEQPPPGRAPGEVGHELDGGDPGVLQVVQHEQHRGGRGERAEDVRDGLEHPAQLHLGAAALRRGRPQHRYELGQQPGEIRGARPGQRHDLGGGSGRQRRGERVDERLQEQRALGGVAARGEHEPAARPRVVDEGVGEPGLAHPAVARHQHDRCAARHGGGPGPGEGGELGGAAGQVRWPFALGGVTQDRQVQLPGRGRGVDAQLVGESRAQRVVGGERLRLLPRGEERGHEQPVGLLVEAVGRDGRRRRIDGGARIARAQRGRRKGEPAHPQEPVALRAGPRHPLRVRLVDEDVAAPEQLQRPSREPGRRVGRRPGLGEQPGDLPQVDAHRRADRVAPATAHDHVGAERAPQPADERRHVVGRPLRGAVGPERLDDGVEGEDPAVRDGEDREQPPGLAAAQARVHRRRSVAPDVEGAQELDGQTGHEPRIARTDLG